MSCKIWVLVALLAAPASATLELVDWVRAPVEEQATILTFHDGELPAEGVEVTAIYRENAHASLRQEQAIGKTDSDGRLTWTPRQAGVVVLQWEGGSQNVSVVHDGLPLGGLLIAFLAGLGLLGGSVFFFLLMLRSPDTSMEREIAEIGEPPST